MIEKQSATKKTALTRAPRTSALAQPNVFFDHFFGDICNKITLEKLKMRKSGFSPLFTHFDRKEGDYEGGYVAEHVKTVRHKGHRVGDISDDDFHEEEGCGQPQHRQETAFLSCKFSHIYT